MNLVFRKFQQGGAAPQGQAPQGAPQEGAQQEQGAPQQGESQDPMAQLIEAAAQAIQNRDCETAMQVCQVLIQLAQQGAQSAQGAPEQGTADEGEPVYRAGGKLSYRIK